VIEILQGEDETFRQAQPGRPGRDTKFVRQSRPRFDVTWRLDAEALVIAERDDGVFPLLTNDRGMTALEVLRAYRRQPKIEKRFSQFKTDFAVAPVFLKDVTRIQGLMAVYFLVLLVQTLIERELRQAMAKAGQVDLRTMVTHTFPLEDIRDAFEMVDAYADGVVKAVIRISDP